MNLLFNKHSLVLLLLLSCLSGEAASTVVRSITGNNTANPMVVITATPDASVSAYAVQDNLPAGLTPANITQGGVWDAVNRMVKWGPFDTNLTALTLSYTVTGIPGTYTVSGVGSFDGVSVPTTGDSQIVLLPPEVSSVVRTITGGTNVSLVATPAPGVSSYAVQETLPAGLTATHITQGGTWDAANAAVKWGPWFDTLARTLSYTVTGNPGTNTVSGVGSFDGVSVPTTGDSRVVIPPPGLPYVPAAAQTSISVLETNGAWQASVTIQFPDPCYKVADWGAVSSAGNTLVADAEVEQPPPGTVCIQIITTASYNYDLGALSPGSYLFVFESWGTEVAEQAFVVKSSSSSVVRTITVGTNVSLVATPAATVSSYAVEENLPAGLTAANVSPGGVWDAANQAVKWGPWYTNTAQTLSYTVAGSPGTYTVSGVGSFDGVSVTTTGDTQVVIVTNLSPPVFIIQPASEVVSLGQGVTFTAGATGNPPPTYQWQFDRVNISGATGASYTIPSTDLGSIGLYDVVVANSAGSSTSSVVSLGFLDLKLLAAVYLTGPIGSAYDIEAASALAPTDWITVTNVTIPTQPFIWVDYSSATNAQQFYRAVPQ